MKINEVLMLTEEMKTLKIANITLRMDMDHLVSRMLERAVDHHQVDILLKKLPASVDKLRSIEPGQQFWFWDNVSRTGLGMRKINDTTLLLKTAISSHPKGDRNPIVNVNESIHLESASGYIPSEKEKNDPRYKTALTKDVKPDTLKKNAKAFGFNISRAGIPPLLRK